MTTEMDLKDIARDLIEHSVQDADFSAKTGVLDDLFPAIYKASKRMSSRAISRWLLEVHGVKLSYVTISKALREADKHWESLWERIEPAARIFAEAHGVALKDYLFDNGLFEGLAHSTPTIGGEDGYGEYESAVGFLRQEWFIYDATVHDSCGKYILEDEKEGMAVEG